MNYYHYTKGCHLQSIVKEGMIRTTNNGCEKKERPAAWLTKSPEWDVACNIGHVLNYQELVSGQIYSSKEIDLVTATNEYMKKEIGMCRILISESLPVISWAKFKYVSKISEEGYNMLDRHSRSNGSPVGQWLCTFSGIPKKYWEGIEILVDDQWVRWDEKMPIQEFVDLCLECNGKQMKEEKINRFPKEHCQKQVDYMKTHKDEIADFWEVNKHKKGYIEIYITPDYQTYPCGFRFIEKPVKKSTFKTLWKSETENYALVHFLWEATFTQYRIALAYEKDVCVDSNKQI
jgi:hypothetical protein